MKRVKKGRGRLSGIELLPREASPIIDWANEELRNRNRTQKDIYAEFFEKLQQLQADYRGELEFTIPSFTAFNQHSIKEAAVSRRMETVREIAGSVSKRFDAASSDELTVIAAEAIKTLVFEILTDAGEGGLDPKGAMQLAAALKAATQAQGVSTIRRQRAEAEFTRDVNKAVEQVAKVKGLTAETAEAIKAKILGVAA
ncbi:MAG: hypothetical protein CMJ42_23030 [Phyllobacteriaceae bacterium]|nr:hypothetical protein [Phyllobacteriaceae bacterium]|tara:strand:+ start:303 stop:899 length:597 start_codon:yes stop_codon:yes gene_type:complete